MTTTIESSRPGRPVYLVADAVSIVASGTADYMVECSGFDWAYIEVDSNRAFQVYGIGHSGFGSSTKYYLFNEAVRVAFTGITAGQPSGFFVHCKFLKQVGIHYSNTDGSNAATLTVRIALVND